MEALKFPSMVQIDPVELKEIFDTKHFIGIGNANGNNRGAIATETALGAFSRNFSFEKAKRFIMHISGGEDLTLYDVQAMTETVWHFAGNNFNPEISLGMAQDSKNNGQIIVTLLANMG